MISYKEYLTKELNAQEDITEKQAFINDVISDKYFPIQSNGYVNYREIVDYFNKKRAKLEVFIIFYQTYIDYILQCNCYTLSAEKENKHIEILKKCLKKTKEMIHDNHESK